MKHVLAIDEGTTGVTCLVVGQDGSVAGRGYREIPQHFPEPGQVEHDAIEIFDATIAAGREAILQAGVTPDAIGITNQRETVVVWERATGKPVHRAIVWQDRRTAERCARMTLAQRERITALTGLVVDPYFSATKLEWLFTNLHLLDKYSASELAIGTIDTWLIWRLTSGAVHATDPTNASRTMLFDIDRMTWSDELLRLFGVPQEVLPDVRPSSGSFGVASAAVFGTEIPILGVAGDQQAALFGQGCVRAGESKNTYGTGAFLLMNTGSKRPPAGDGLLATVACDPRGKPAYALEGAIFIAGAAIQWLRDGLAIVGSAAETEAMARSVASNEGVYFVPALTGLGAPHWEPRARGTIVGLTRGSTRAHLVRAALESMALGTADVLDTMVKWSGSSFSRLRVDGGATANSWLMELQADVLDVPVERPDMIETTALGAAALAGLEAGVWRDIDEFTSARSYTEFKPVDGRTNVETLRREWERAVRAARSWAADDA